MDMGESVTKGDPNHLLSQVVLNKSPDLQESGTSKENFQVRVYH